MKTGKGKWRRPLVVWISLLACAFTVLSCSTSRKTLSTAGVAIDVLGQGHKAKRTVQKARNYLMIADKLRKFHDSGELSQEDVLDVLRRSGVLLPKTGKPSASPIPPPVEKYDGAFRWPLDEGVVSSEFGKRWGKMHNGIDVANEAGVPVRAAADGVIAYSGSKLRGYGHTVIVRHDRDVTTLYAHNKKLLVKKGQRVKQGQTIALLGSSGRSTGPHVHFEIRQGEHAINPRQKLVKANTIAQSEELFPSRSSACLIHETSSRGLAAAESFPFKR